MNQPEALALATLAYCCNTANAIMYALTGTSPSSAAEVRSDELAQPYSGTPGGLNAEYPAVSAALPAAGRCAAQKAPRISPQEMVVQLKQLADDPARLTPVLNRHIEEIICTHRYKNHDRAIASFKESLSRWVGRMRLINGLSAKELWTYFTQNNEYWIITPGSSCWPGQLSDLSRITDSTPPLCLWGKGDPNALISCDSPVGIVGSRDCTEYGRSTAFNAARQAALHGHCIVSGGAMGIDACAHWGALSAYQDIGDQCGKTVAIFAGGLNTCGPKCNSNLFDTICSHHGALISELPPDTLPESFRFLMRNRLIASLSRTLIVAQARHRSGALNSATWAADMNRDVYAAPGDNNKPYNTGCNALIAEGKATLLLSSTDISGICHSAHPPCTR